MLSKLRSIVSLVPLVAVLLIGASASRAGARRLPRAHHQDRGAAGAGWRHRCDRAGAGAGNGKGSRRQRDRREQGGRRHHRRNAGGRVQRGGRLHAADGHVCQRGQFEPDCKIAIRCASRSCACGADCPRVQHRGGQSEIEADARSPIWLRRRRPSPEKFRSAPTAPAPRPTLAASCSRASPGSR